MNNEELKEILYDMVADEDLLDQMIVLEGDELADGAIGVTHDGHIVYSYERLVESLTKAYGSETEAIEWIDYNTIRSLPYMGKDGLAPVIMYELIS